jgi:uncharacterized protein YndB with AHSA1/START domain
VKYFQSETLINAHASTVWNVITDAGNLTVWESGITTIDGELKHGAKIRIRTTAGGKRTFRFQVRQLPREVMTWTGGLPFGLLKRTRTFTLTPEKTLTRLRVTEELKGPLTVLDRKTSAEMMQALSDYVSATKSRAELFARGPWNKESPAADVAVHMPTGFVGRNPQHTTEQHRLSALGRPADR